jgi:DNA-binding LytR/AlgR family response regulator
LARPRKIIGKLGEEFHLLDSNQVLAFQAERELVWIVTRRQRYLATQPLKTIQEKLGGLNFARIHRNALVNLDHVTKMTSLSSQRWLLTLANQQEFIVSKLYQGIRAGTWPRSSVQLHHAIFLIRQKNSWVDFGSENLPRE